MKYLFDNEFETWENTPKSIRELIHRENTLEESDIKSEMELLK